MAAEKRRIATFGAGPRRCLGQWFAQAEARAFVTNIVKHDIGFDFSCDSGAQVKTRMLCTGLPSRDIMVIPQVQRYKSKIDPARSGVEREMVIAGIRPENKNASVKTFRLQYADQMPLVFSPGDYIKIFHSGDQGGLRHYTISSSPLDSTSWIEVTTKLLNKGRMTNHQHRHWAIGDTVLVHAPFSDGNMPTMDRTEEPLVLISGGIGITPMISVIKYWLAKRSQRDIYFIHSCKHPDDLCFASLIEACDACPHFHLLLNYTQYGARQRIAKSMLHDFGLEKVNHAEVYLCGSLQMCSDLKTLLVDGFNFDGNRLFDFSFGVIDWAILFQAEK